MSIKLDEILEKLSKNSLYSNALKSVESEDVKKNIEIQTREFVEALCGPLIQCINQIEGDESEAEKLRSILRGPIEEKTIVTINDDGK